MKAKLKDLIAFIWLAYILAQATGMISTSIPLPTESWSVGLVMVVSANSALITLWALRRLLRI
jgi:hypothetical protein